MEMRSTFHLYSQDITFTQEQLLYYKLKREFSPVARQQHQWYLKTFDGYTTDLEKYLQNGESIFRQALDPVCKWGIDTLAAYGYYDETEATLKNKVYEQIKDELDDVKAMLSDLKEDLEQQAADRAHHRQLRKQYRKKAYGTYYLSSKMKAGTINFATGTAHSIANALGNAGDSLQVMSEKNEGMKQMRPVLEELVQDAISDVFYFVCEKLKASTPIFTNEEEARLENLARMPKETATKVAFELLQKNPEEEKLYSYFLKTYKDPDGTLQALATQFDVDLDNTRKELLDAVYKELSIETLEETRASIEAYKKELAQYAQTEDDNLKRLYEVEKKQFDAARTFHGTLYDTIEERQAAEARYEEEKENIDLIAPHIDAEIEKLTLMYTPESFEAAKATHDMLEKRYAGLARTEKMLQLKQFLYVYTECQNNITKANENKASQKKMIIAAALCAFWFVLNIFNSPASLIRWGLAIGFGIFLWSQMNGLVLKKQGAAAQTILESGTTFQPRDTLQYTGKENYSLEHTDNAPDPQIKKEKNLALWIPVAAVLLTGFIAPLLNELFR